MNRERPNPSTTNKSEPLFIKFANFDFPSQTLEKFLDLIKSTGVETPPEELFVCYGEDKEDPNSEQFLTEAEKENVLKDLELARQEFRKLLLDLRQKDKFDNCLEKINYYCAEVPNQFTYHEKDSEKLDLALPSIKNIAEVGWGNILGLMAIDLGKYLMENPVTRIRFCKNKNCRKFFTRRGGKAIFCSEDCKNEFHHNEKRDSGYFRSYMKEGRIKGVYQRKKKRTVKTISK